MREINVKWRVNFGKSNLKAIKIFGAGVKVLLLLQRK